MIQPKGFVDPNNARKVYRLQWSIYGLKQASRSWNLCFDETIKVFGFVNNEDDPYVYKKCSGSNVVFLILYVDDILILEKDILLLQDVKAWLSHSFSIKDLGKASYILGIKIYRDRSRKMIGLSRITYIDKVLERFNMDNDKKGFNPMQSGIHLSKAQSPVSRGDQDRMSRVSYASTIGSIMYAMIFTQPNVSYALSMTSRYQSN